MNSFRKRGLALPMILVLVALLGTSMVIISALSSDNRNVIAGAEHRLRCHMAATSAITEAKGHISYLLSEESSSWPEFFKELLPPLKKLPEDKWEMHTGTTAQSFAPNVYISKVTVSPLIKHSVNGTFQGLLSISVTTELSISTFNTISCFREEIIPFVALKGHKGVSLMLLPVTESVVEKVK